MVDVTAKAVTERTAVARGFVRMSPKVLRALRQQKVPKGNPLEIARIAGIAAAKRTAEWIPLCHPLQQLHGDEVLAFRFIDLVNRANVRMIERGRGEGFSLEPFAGSRVVSHLCRQELQRNMAVQLEVFGFVHHTHPAATEFLQNTVVRDGFADQAIHNWWNGMFTTSRGQSRV